MWAVCILPDVSIKTTCQGHPIQSVTICSACLTLNLEGDSIEFTQKEHSQWHNNSYNLTKTHKVSEVTTKQPASVLPSTSAELIFFLMSISLVLLQAYNISTYANGCQSALLCSTYSRIKVSQNPQSLLLLLVDLSLYYDILSKKMKIEKFCMATTMLRIAGGVDLPNSLS